MTLTIGFFINPKAGEGINYRKNGSDRIGDVPKFNYAAGRAMKFLESLNRYYKFKTASGDMGETVLKNAEFQDVEVIYESAENSTMDDTIKFVKMAENVCDVILFAGGDGTARDIFSVKPDIPVLGIPSGMKMYSSVFARDPEEASYLLDLFSAGKGKIVQAIIEDANEEKMEHGDLEIKRYGKLKSLSAPGIHKDPKMVSYKWSEDSIAEYIADNMDSSYYLVGTGSTCKGIMEYLGLESTVFQVDLIRNGKLIKSNYFPQDFEKFIEVGVSLKIVVSPYAGNGFFLGRGNRQIDARAIKRAGKNNIIVVSSERKLETITGLVYDVEGIEEDFFGKYLKVLTGYGNFKMIPLII